MVGYALSQRVSIHVRVNSAYCQFTYRRHKQSPRVVPSEFRGFKTYYLGWHRRCF